MPTYDVEVTKDDIEQCDGTYAGNAVALACKRVLPIEVFGVTREGFVIAKGNRYRRVLAPIPPVKRCPESSTKFKVCI